VRTEPLKALVIGAFVRGLWMRDVESLCEQAGLGKLSKSTASRICEELRERFAAVQAPGSLHMGPDRPAAHAIYHMESRSRRRWRLAPVGQAKQ
jgi:hypothetical protein